MRKILASLFMLVLMVGSVNAYHYMSSSGATSYTDDITLSVSIPNRQIRSSYDSTTTSNKRFAGVNCDNPALLVQLREYWKGLKDTPDVSVLSTVREVKDLRENNINEYRILIPKEYLNSGRYQTTARLFCENKDGMVPLTRTLNVPGEIVLNNPAGQTMESDVQCTKYGCQVGNLLFDKHWKLVKTCNSDESCAPPTRRTSF